MKISRRTVLGIISLLPLLAVPTAQAVAVCCPTDKPWIISVISRAEVKAKIRQIIESAADDLREKGMEVRSDDVEDTIQKAVESSEQSLSEEYALTPRHPGVWWATP